MINTPIIVIEHGGSEPTRLTGCEQLLDRETCLWVWWSLTREPVSGNVDQETSPLGGHVVGEGKTYLD